MATEKTVCVIQGNKKRASRDIPTKKRTTTRPTAAFFLVHNNSPWDARRMPAWDGSAPGAPSMILSISLPLVYSLPLLACARERRKGARNLICHVAPSAFPPPPRGCWSISWNLLVDPSNCKGQNAAASQEAHQRECYHAPPRSITAESSRLGQSLYCCDASG